MPNRLIHTLQIAFRYFKVGMFGIPFILECDVMFSTLRNNHEQSHDTRAA